MSIPAIISRGYGSFGSVPGVVTRGYLSALSLPTVNEVPLLGAVAIVPAFGGMVDLMSAVDGDVDIAPGFAGQAKVWL